MNCRIRLFLFIFQLIPLTLIAQDQAVEVLINRFLPELETELNSESLLEEIQLLFDNPINPNTASRSDYERVFFIDDKVIESLINHREKYGEFITVYELAYVDGVTHEILELLLPFISLSPSVERDKPLLKSIADSDKRIITRFSRKLVGSPSQINGADESAYFGSIDHIFGRLSLHDPSRLKLGISFEKDAGERISWDRSKKQFGFDHYSFHLMISCQNIFSKVIIGDYKLLIGQGLVQGSAFSLGKGMDPVASVRKKGQTIRPHSGSAEFGYLRGVAAEFDIGQVKITSYSSYSKLDAIVQGMDIGVPYVRSISETGLHRTSGELSRKNILPRLIVGVNSDYRNKSRKFLSGITMQFSQFGYPIIPDKRVYNQFDFKGRSNFLGGVHFQYSFKDIFFFGEGAIAGNFAAAFIAGVIGNISDLLETTLLVRNYGKSYYAFNANGFGESDQTRNEKGIYWGARIRPAPKLQIELYYDHFQFPWLKYRAYSPSGGYDTQLRINYKLNRYSMIYFQFRQKEKEHNILVEDKVYGLESLTKRAFRVNWSYKPEMGFRINFRIQWSGSEWNDLTTSGVCLVQDIGWYGDRIKLMSRFAIFDADNYENRQYVYENDVLYYYYIPAYSGKGIRNYIVLNYKVNWHISASVKVARTYQNDQLTDNSFVPAFSTWDFRAQIQLRL